MSHKYDNGWNNWHGPNSWNSWHGQNGGSYWKGSNGWSWGCWKGQDPHYGYYSHYHHVPRRFGGFKFLLTVGLAFWAGSAYTRKSMEGRNRGGENHPVVQQQQQSPVIDQNAPVNQAAPLQPQTQDQQRDFDYRKSWRSWRKCRAENTQFLLCLNKNDGEIGACQPFFDIMKECEKKYL